MPRISVSPLPLLASQISCLSSHHQLRSLQKFLSERTHSNSHFTMSPLGNHTMAFIVEKKLKCPRTPYLGDFFLGKIDLKNNKLWDTHIPYFILNRNVV